MGVKGIKNTLNYGANRIRYLTPVPAGSKLRGGVSILSADVMPPYGLRGTPFSLQNVSGWGKDCPRQPGQGAELLPSSPGRSALSLPVMTHAVGRRLAHIVPSGSSISQGLFNPSQVLTQPS